MAASTPEMEAADSQSSQWSGSGRLRGGVRGVGFVLGFLRLLGLRATYALLVVPVLYFTFFSPDVTATMEYHRRIFGAAPPWRRWWRVYRHFYAFGRSLVDGQAILSGNTKRFSFRFDGEEHLREALAEGNGVLLLTAHVGNWAAASQLLSRLEVPINVTGFDNETDEMRALLDRASRPQFRMLPLTGEPMEVVTLVAALRRGEVVAMMGDRAYSGPSAKVPFIGGTVSFPMGPYILAAAAGAPLVTAFNLHEPGGRYRLVAFPVQRFPMLPRRQSQESVDSSVMRFASELESVLREHPLQWYNFYPYWDD